MKKKISISFAVSLLISFSAFSQDSTRAKVPSDKSWPAITDRRYEPGDSADPKLYRPTRLGSSEPQYDTYKKNDYGAGAVTTEPK
ncbi:MAG: hypothetical protein ABIO82_06290 [Ginsengibacter sp.]